MHPHPSHTTITTIKKVHVRWAEGGKKGGGRVRRRVDTKTALMTDVLGQFCSKVSLFMENKSIKIQIEDKAKLTMIITNV